MIDFLNSEEKCREFEELPPMQREGMLISALRALNERGIFPVAMLDVCGSYKKTKKGSIESGARYFAALAEEKPHLVSNYPRYKVL